MKRKETEIWEIVSGLIGSIPIDMLEIGVYKGATIGKAFSLFNIQSYTGIDPYIGDVSDPYLFGYWNSEGEAFSIYKESYSIFKKLGGDLYKTTSEIFYNVSDPEKKYDVIYIDGDHRFRPALFDMWFWFKRLKVGGVLVVDDYANSDHPEVTRAVNLFLDGHIDCVDVYECEREFKNGKHISIFSKQIIMHKNKEKSNPTALYLWGMGKIANSFYQKYGKHLDLKGVLDNNSSVSEWNGVYRVQLDKLEKDSLIIIATNYQHYIEITKDLKLQGRANMKDFIKYDYYRDLYLEGWDRKASY